MTKPLSPTLRERNRYLVFALACESPQKQKEVAQSVYSAATRLLGELGASKASLHFIEWNEQKQRGILKCNHKSVPEARAALTVLTEVAGKKAAARTLGLSGTLKKTREKWM
jgi:ribonuclease P/MRP protein subunit POP5